MTRRKKRKKVSGPPTQESVLSNSRLETRANLWFAGVFFFALAVRALYLWEMDDQALFEILMGDAREYDAWARRLAAGDWLGREVFYQAPFYPYFVGVIYDRFGSDLSMLRAIQLVIGSASCLLLAVAGRRFFSMKTGLLAGVLLALYPPAIFFDGLIQKAVLGLFFTCLLLLLASRLLEEVRWRDLLFSGVVLGCFALVRENALVLYGLIVLWLFVHFRSKPLGARLRWSAAFTTGVVLVLLPVGLRNQAVGGDFLVTTSQAGPNFFIGNNLEANGQYRPLKKGRGNVSHELEDARNLAEAALGRPLNPAEISRYWIDRAVSYIRAHPAHWFRLMLRKWLWVWNGRELMDTESMEIYEEHSFVLRLLGLGLHFGILVPLAAAGIWMTRNDYRRLGLLYLALVSMASGVALFFVFARYRLPMVPILVLFSAAGLVCLAADLTRGRYQRLVSCVPLMLVTGIIANWPLRAQEDPRALGYHNLGVALAEEGRHQEAVHYLERGLEVRPDSVALLTSLGRALPLLGRSAEAVEHFERALEVEPGNAEARTGLGNVLAKVGALQVAGMHYGVVLKSQPANVNVLINLGNVKVLQRRTDEAIELYARALRIEPDRVEFHLNLAGAYAREARVQEAIGRYEKALEIQPNHAEAHFDLANLLAMEGKAEEAASHYESTLRLLPEHGDARRSLELLRAGGGPGESDSGLTSY